MDSNKLRPLKKQKLDPKLNSTESYGQIFKGKQLLCLDRAVFLSIGADYGSVTYHGFWKEKDDSKEKAVVVRRIKVTDCLENWEDVVDKHLSGNLSHDNVLKILGVENNEADQSRYFALELYAATLEQFCAGQYTGPMPSDAQVLYQIARGVNYLHKNGLAHGNLNPQTILISQSQPVRIKVSEFGLCNCYEKDEIETKKSTLKISHPKYWMRTRYGSLPVNKDGNRLISSATVNGDMFAAGCLFFYYLKRGLHPFGYAKSIVTNISKKKPVHLEELQRGFAFDGIKNLIGNRPRDGTYCLALIKFASHLKTVLPLAIDEKEELGRGAFGNVFTGTFEGKKVAVKRISVAVADSDTIKKEVEYHNRLDHKNVLKLLHVDEEKDPRFKYLVLELCAGTLTNFCENKYKGPNLPPDILVLFQIATGLDYIHSRNLVHRDVKPDNILISITTPAQMKLSDFGYCRKVSPQGTFTQSGLKGTMNWMAPELLRILNNNPHYVTNDLPRGTIESDTFAAGCVFFYFLTRGLHPFGNSTFVPANICDNNPVVLNEGKLLPTDKFGHALVGGMIKELDERTKLEEVIQQLAPFLPQPSTINFKKVTRPLPTTSSSYICSRFHPTDPVLACGLEDGQVILFQTTSSLLPFSYWREDKGKFTQNIIGKKVTALEWNVSGTRLAAGFEDGTVIAWSYPSGHVLFRMKKHSSEVDSIVWNPIRQDVLATRDWVGL